MSTPSTITKLPRKQFIVKPLSNEVKEAIVARIENSYGSIDVSSMINLQYKGESFLLITRQEKNYNAPNTKKYLALKELKAFLGRGNEELSEWVNSLNPHTVKQGMKRALGNNTTNQYRMLYAFPKQDITQLSRLRSNAGSLSDTAYELKCAWSNTTSGDKAQNRKYAKQLSGRSKRIFGSVYSEMVGGVHTESGLYLKAHKEKLTKILDTNKKPMTSERHYGIEMEFMMPKENKEAIKDALMASPYKNMLCLTRDGSVTSTDVYDPAELKVCVPHSQMEECVSFVTKVLAVNSCAIDKSCGLHVHLDARKGVGDVRSMFDRLLDQQSCLMALVPKSRRSNQYCKPTKRKDFRRGERYKTINSQSYSKYQTLEVRLHGGTIDPNKIINWITLIGSIAYNTNPMTASRTVKTMLAKISLPTHTAHYVTERAVKFATVGA